MGNETKVCKHCEQAKSVFEYSTGRAVCKKCFAAKAKMNYKSKISLKSKPLISIVIQDGKETFRFNSELKPYFTMSTNKRKITVTVEELSDDEDNILGTPAIPMNKSRFTIAKADDTDIDTDTDTDTDIPEVTVDEALLMFSAKYKSK